MIHGIRRRACSLLTVLLAVGVVTTSPLGAQVDTGWVRVTTQGHSSGLALSVDDSGNIYVAQASGANDYQKRVVLTKYNPDGLQVWERQSTQIISCSRIVLDSSMNIYAAGTIPTGFSTAKLSPSCSLLWQDDYVGSSTGNDEIEGLTVDNQGSAVIIGKVFNSTTQFDWMTVKYDNSGTFQWDASYHFSGFNPDVP